MSPTLSEFYAAAQQNKLSASKDSVAGSNQNIASNGQTTSPSHLPGSQYKLPGSHANLSGSQAHLPGSLAYLPGSQAYLPGSHANLPGSQAYLPGSHANLPGSQAGSPSHVPVSPSRVLPRLPTGIIDNPKGERISLKPSLHSDFAPRRTQAPEHHFLHHKKNRLSDALTRSPWCSPLHASECDCTIRASKCLSRYALGSMVGSDTTDSVSLRVN